VKYKIILICILCLLAGILFSVINDYYPLTYLFNIIIDKGIQINPEAEINPEREYVIDIWYYPIYRTIKSENKIEDLFIKIKKDINSRYTNINLRFKKLSFINGSKKLKEALKKGNPPDIYFNIYIDGFLNKKYQIPVEWYIDEQEKEGYYTVNWDNINRENHLWGFPFLVSKQVWIANSKIKNNFADEKQLLKYLSQIENKKIFFNIYDENLLRQLLSIFGLKDFKVIDGELNKETKKCLKEMYNYLYTLRKKDLVVCAVNGSMLKKLSNEKNIIAGPVNPWMYQFIKTNNIAKNKMSLINRIKVYSLNIFRQKNYRGDDHTKAVMEVAKYISKEYSDKVAAELKINPGYSVTPEFIKEYGNTSVKILRLTPLEQQYWQENIIPVWIDFWEENLTVEDLQTNLLK